MAVQISGNDITVPRDTTVTRNLTVGGVLTYEDVTNVDSVGLVTARSGIEIGARPGVAASISVDGNMIISGISTFGGAINGSSGTFSGNVDIHDSIRHFADIDTKIRFPSADTFTVETGGSERLRVDSSGNVKINNTRTTATKLQVVGGTASGTAYDVAVFAGGQNSTSGSGAKIYLSGCENDPLSRGTVIEGIATNNSNAHALIFKTSASSAAPTERLRITASGNMGLGTNGDPMDFVELKNSTAQKKLVLSKSNSGTADQHGMWLQFNNYGPSGTARAADTIIGKLHFYASQPTSGNLQDAGAIECRSDGSQTGNNTRSYLSFKTVNSQTATERMRIDKDGFVGIGTDNPADKVDIHQGALRMLTHQGGGGSTTHCNYIHFPVVLHSGTKTIATLSNTNVATVCFAKIDYATLYGYSGDAMGMGTRYASLRRTNSDTAWRAFNNQAGQNNGENHRPNLFFTNNVLYCDIGGSVQLTGIISIVATQCTLTRNIDITD